MKQFWFDGVGSASMGVMTTGAGTYNAPERDMEMISIPGRDGDLIIDHGRFKNIPVSFPVSICRRFPEQAEAIRAWLLSRRGYKRLEDDYDPEHFRLAAYRGPLNFEVGFLNRTGEATIQFDCKPQRFLKAGELPVSFTAAGTLRNPTLFPAKPLITISGDGAGTKSYLYIGDYKITALSMGDNLTIDCDTLEIYSVDGEGVATDEAGNVLLDGSADELAGLDNADAVTLQAGEITISFEGGITGVTIVPRWWTV